MDVKTLKGARVEIKDAEQGTVEAVFSTLDVVDSDGDVTKAGAFEDGAAVRISAYGHASWGGALPVGRGTIKVVKDEAILSGQFFMDTTHGLDTFRTVKGLGELQEWSYGFDVTKESFGDFNGQQVRFLEGLKTYEVSPVLLGAGLNTRTIASKSASQIAKEAMTALEAGRMDPDVAVAAVVKGDSKPGDGSEGRKALIAPHQTAIDGGPWDSTAVKALPDDDRPSALRSMHAWCDPEADPERKSSYRLAHHHGPDQAANLRAVVAGVAALNGSDGAGVPEAERKAAYDHLAAHMRDADMDPPEFGAGPVSGLKFFDHGAVVLAAVSSFVDRASEVMALRATKGKGFSPGSADLLSWIQDETVRLKTLLTPPPPVEEPLRDDELSTLMAAQAIVQNL